MPPDAAAPPALLARVRDPAVPDAALTEVEAAARSWRLSVFADLGGPDAVSTTKATLVDAALGSWLLLQHLDAELLALAEAGALVDPRDHRAVPLVADRTRVADGLLRQLQALGLERRARQPASLSQYLARRRPANGPPAPPNGVGAPAEAGA